jgi:hypothetical protein
MWKQPPSALRRATLDFALTVITNIMAMSNTFQLSLKPPSSVKIHRIR